MNPFRLAAIAALVAFSLPALADEGLLEAGCATGQTFTGGAIAVTGAYTRAMLPRAASAGGYLSIANAGSVADTLTGASSAAAAQLDLHQMTLEGDMMKMAPVEGGLEIPAGGSVALAPSGYHLMFTGIETPFREGACVVVTLHFAVAGDVRVELNVGAIAQGEPVLDHDMHHDMEHGADPGMAHEADHGGHGAPADAAAP